MNESKISDHRIWAKWKQSGSLGTYESNLFRTGLAIKAIGKHGVGPTTGNSTLSIGSKIINEGILDGSRWFVTVPIVAVVAPGYDYKLGQVLKRLPEGIQSITSVFGDDRKVSSSSSRNR